MAHSANFYGGWSLILASFAIGAAIGLFFHGEQFWGGYTSGRRRMARLGHIALAALGMLNLIYSLSPGTGSVAGGLLLAGGIAMPAVCFLSAWRKPLRHLFFIPVSLLVLAVVIILVSGANP